MSSFHAFTYINLSNIEIVEKIYADFKRDANLVDPSWRYFFEGMEFGGWDVLNEKDRQEGRVPLLIEAYRRYGHLKAHINPLEERPASPIELALRSFGFEERELTALFPTYGLLSEQEAPLSSLIAALETIYCGTIGMECTGLQSHALEKWIQQQVESFHFKTPFSIDERRSILYYLNKAELFEVFLHTKYVGQKRFSLEGAETLIPILSEIIHYGSEQGMGEFVIGMAHRGRLNVLANILDKSYSWIFSEFEDYIDLSLIKSCSDVKYHRGFSSDILTRNGKKVHIGLTANPSHLESVDPVVEGRVKAKQIFHQDEQQTKIVPILIHGDSSLAGQGVVYETLQFGQLPGYGTGGTIHLIVNNQIGFTTHPKESRSTRYCTDIAKTVGAPVFHVNADDPEGCIVATRLAILIRQKFHVDVFIDLNCYRKYGHNEGDEPFFTQPLEYTTIRKRASIRERYRNLLIQEGVMEKEMALALEEEFKKGLSHELEEMRSKKHPFPEPAFEGIWKEYKQATQEELFKPVHTAVSSEELRRIAEALSHIPADFTIHPKLKKLIEERKKMGEGQHPLDWAMGEQLAFGTLLSENVPIRLSGQDSQRGTFTHRHSVWVDQKSGEKYFPLAHLGEKADSFTVYNSPLSEYAVLGFEYGYSLSFPSALVIWEAQYGDFANGAQIIFDQYLSGSAEKWHRYSGLVLLLPHGYEGQGSEHSSARLERFLQLGAQSNMQVVYPTTPAQYFHLLRRQMRRKIRVPLVVMSPKGLLRHSECISSLEDFSQGTFQEFLDDPQEKTGVKRVLLCTGRIYYDLIAERKKRAKEEYAIIRLEQLYPFSHEKFAPILEGYKNVEEYYWVQEEPENMGAYSFIAPLVQESLPKKKSLHYVGRERSAAVASGVHTLHAKEHAELMNRAFD